MVRKSGVQSQVQLYQKLKNMLLDADLLNTQHYNVQINGKVCNILTFKPAVNQEPGASGRRYQGITLTG